MIKILAIGQHNYEYPLISAKYENPELSFAILRNHLGNKFQNF